MDAETVCVARFMLVLQVRPVVFVLPSSPADLLVCPVLSLMNQAAQGSKKAFTWRQGWHNNPKATRRQKQIKSEPYLVAAGG